MDILEQIRQYKPVNLQEMADKQVMLEYIIKGDRVWERANKIAHFTASAWIVNASRDKVLMAYHNIYQSWAWTGGHADGNKNLAEVAVKEALEETGLSEIKCLLDEIYSLETIRVDGHMKNGLYVPTHLHLNVTYLLEADEEAPLTIKADENAGLQWFKLEEAIQKSTEPWMQGVYRKLNDKLEKKAIKSL